MEGVSIKYPMKHILRTAKFLTMSKVLPGPLTDLSAWVGFWPKAGCQISTLIFDFFLWRGVSINMPLHEKYIKDGKVLDHFGIKSKVLPGSSTDLSAWVGFCTSSPQAGYQISTLIFDFFLWRGGLYNIP